MCFPLDKGILGVDYLGKEALKLRGASSKATNLLYIITLSGREGCIGLTKPVNETFINVAKLKVGRIGDSIWL